MAESVNPEANISPLNTDAKVEEADFTAVVFHGVADVYPPAKDIQCCYAIKPSVKASNKDWVGLFKVGWQYSKEHYTYEWSPFSKGAQDEGKPVHNMVVFRAKYLPKCEEEFYQFCYVTSSGEVRGASVPFQIKTKADESEFEFCEVEDDESMLLVKNRTAIIEDSLAKALDENACLKVSNERMKSDLETLSDTVMSLEKRKVELTTQINHERKQNSMLSKELNTTNKNMAAKNEDQETLRNRIAELETSVKDLETSKQELRVIIDHSNKKVEEFTDIFEKEQLQCSEAQKSRDKLVNEKLQYLQKIAANRELVDNLSTDVKKKNGEISSLKEEKENLNSVVAKLKQDLEQNNLSIKDLQDELAAEKDRCLLVKSHAENESGKTKEEMQALSNKVKFNDAELKNIKDTVQMLTAKIKLLEKEKDEIMDSALAESVSFENKIKTLLEEGFMKNEEIQRLEYETEDLRNQIGTEKGRNLALEEDYEAALRGIENQLEGEKALNESLCVQTDTTVSDLQQQLEHQLVANAEQGRMLESKTTEAKEALEELGKEKNLVKSSEEKLKVAFNQLSAADKEVKGLKSVKESLQMSINDSQGKNRKHSRNSAASMYALQTAHTHLEKKYLEAKKKLEEMWKDKNEFKRALAAIQNGLPANDLRHEIEEFRAKNEDLRARLNMGAEAYKSKFIECRRLENQLGKLKRSPSCESKSEGSVVLIKLQQELEEEHVTNVAAKKALDEEKEKIQQKSKDLEEVTVQMNLLKENLATVETEGHQKTSSLTKYEDEKAELTTYVQKLENDIAERRSRLTQMEELFQNEKTEKHNLIEEIMNLQEQIKVWELEKDGKNKEMEELRLALAQERQACDNLGEEARKKIQELEDTVQKLTKEVDRWKKEVDMHVEAQAKMIASGPETREQQQQTPLVSRSPLQWPWHRPGNGGMPYPTNQPWVVIPRDPEANPPPVNPYFTQAQFPPTQVPPPPPPEPMQSFTPDHECPVCKILFPPGANIKDLQEHVEAHFTGKDQ